MPTVLVGGAKSLFICSACPGLATRTRAGRGADPTRAAADAEGRSARDQLGHVARAPAARSVREARALRVVPLPERVQTA